MFIGKFAERCGVSARAVRHYEVQGLLHPERTPQGYRRYTVEDEKTVAKIRVMIEAGLGTEAIRQYQDCLRRGRTRYHLELCPDLSAELDRIEERLDRRESSIRATRAALARITD